MEIAEEKNAPQNLKFTCGEDTYGTLKEFEEKFKGTIDANSEEKVKTYKIDWEWPYTTGTNDSEIAANDLKDTNNAKQGDYSCNIKVTGVQVKPQA